MNKKQFDLLATQEPIEDQFQSASQQDDDLMNKHRLVIFYVLVALVILTFFLNVFTPKPAVTVTKQIYNDELQSLTQVQQHQVMDKLESQYQKNSYKIAFGNKSLQRISYGQPRPKNSFIRAVIFKKKDTKSERGQCLFTNGVNIISNKTSLTGKNFLAQKQIKKWILFLANIDLVADDIITQFMNETNNIYEKQSHQLVIDSNYRFIRYHTLDCESLIYVQNHFLIDQHNLQLMVEANIKAKSQLKQGYCMYSKIARNLEDNITKLQNLRKTDLFQFKQQKFNQYVYIFTTDFLNVITPFNFVNFNRYTLEQMIIYPILALTQNSNKLIQIHKAFHRFDEAVIHLKQFQLAQIPKSIKEKSVCFVSYPTDPKNVSIQDFKQYINSIASLDVNDEKITIVIYIPYTYKQIKQGLYEVFNQVIKARKLRKQFVIRIRLQQSRAVSSLALYQSAHTFCPQQSHVISSRQNVIFYKQLITKLTQNVAQKVNYYSTNPRLPSQKIRSILNNNQDIRFDVQSFLVQFSQVQIFRLQLMKMVNIWALKVDQMKFFQTQAAFVVPMLQMCGHFVKKVSETELYKIKVPRKISIQQNLEMKILKKFAKWDKIKDYVLIPIKYNSLTNLDLRRGALDNIPKIIHQIWFKDQAIPQKIHDLQDTIKQVNKDYKYILWRKQNLTTIDFPMSYNHIAKIYEYQWVSGRSYHPWIQALMSYQILYNHGGIYLSLKCQAIKPLDPFLKYQLFFAGYYNNVGNYGAPLSIGRQVMGSKIHGYHMRFIISELIGEQRILLQLTDYQALVGGDIVRMSLNNNQLFTTTAYGFHLFTYDPFRTEAGLCDNEPIPCKQYSQSYIIIRNLN